MIYEIRTYTVKPGNVPEYEKRFADAIDVRMQYSPMYGMWHTEIGPLNQIVHIWAYPSLDERERRRAALAEDPAWQAFAPKIQALMEEMENKIMKPARFSPLA